MKDSHDIRESGKQLYDLMKERHELYYFLTDEDTRFTSELPQGSSLLETDQSPRLSILLMQNAMKRHPDKVKRYREVNAEIEALRAENEAYIAAGWASTMDLHDRTFSND